MKRSRESSGSGDDITELNMLISQKHQNVVRDSIYKQYLAAELCDITLIAGDDGRRFVSLSHLD